MLLLAFAAFLVGVALCRFFRVLVLAPACIAILVVAVVMSAYVGHDLLHSSFEFAVLWISLQFGYASGLLLAAVPGILQRVRNGRMHAPTAAPKLKTVARHWS
jgi:fatty acid desaturase